MMHITTIAHSSSVHHMRVFHMRVFSVSTPSWKSCLRAFLRRVARPYTSRGPLWSGKFHHPTTHQPQSFPIVSEPAPSAHDHRPLLLPMSKCNSRTSGPQCGIPCVEVEALSNPIKAGFPSRPSVSEPRVCPHHWTHRGFVCVRGRLPTAIIADKEAPAACRG